MARGDSTTNTVLLACLDAIRPEDLNDHAWSKCARVSHNYFENLRLGSEPSIYKVERLVRVAGVSLSAFWKMVERRRGE